MPNEITPEFPPLTARERQLMRRIEDQNGTICALKQALNGTERRCRMLEDDNETMRRTMQQIQVDERRCKMFRVLERYVREDVEPDTIGCNVYAFVDLIKEEETA